MVLGLFMWGCDGSCFLEGNDTNESLANAKCVPQDGSLSCDRVCEAATECPDFGSDYDVYSCIEQCSDTVAGINSHDYNVGVACLYAEGGATCEALQKCAGNVGVPIPGGGQYGVWVNKGVEPTSSEDGLCDNDLDDDHDGEQDCMDSDCSDAPECQPDDPALLFDF